MGRQRPAAVSNALRVQWLLVAAGAVGTLLAFVLREEMLLTWIEANPNAAAYYEQGGMEALEESSLSIPAFVPVAVVSFIIYALLAWVLGALFGHGHRWARWSLVALAAGVLFAVYVVVGVSPPTAFVVLVSAVAALDLLLLVLLLQRDCGEWVRGAALAEEHERIS